MKNINEEYFEWLYDTMTNDLGARDNIYTKLFVALHTRPFTYFPSIMPGSSMANDANRLEDGINLRYRFGREYGYSRNEIKEGLTEPCSVLEMMEALAIRCEEGLMDDPKYGNRTTQWFWNMIKSLGLVNMDDSNFNKSYVDDVLDIFLNREYNSDGSGGLFTIRNSVIDMRRLEIWYQLCRYIDAYYNY